MTCFKPTIYSNQRPIISPADLDNHPLAREYIDYILSGGCEARSISYGATAQFVEVTHYPVDFNTWLERREYEKSAELSRDAMEIKVMQNDPFCRSPIKIRIHHRKKG